MLITVNGRHFGVLGIVMCRIRSRSEMYKLLSWKLIENQNKKRTVFSKILCGYHNRSKSDLKN